MVKTELDFTTKVINLLGKSLTGRPQPYLPFKLFPAYT